VLAIFALSFIGTSTVPTAEPQSAIQPAPTAPLPLD
jgi:hypothetical protein